MKRITICLGFIIMLTGLSGCGSSTPSKFYLLNGMAQQHSRNVCAHHRHVIGLGPVTLPKYLNQPQIVTRESDNQLHLAEFHRWAEPLDDNITHVVSNNLTRLLGTRHVVTYPWKASDKVDYQVKVNIHRFDPTCGGKVYLQASWQLFRTRDHKLLCTKSRTYVEYMGCEFNYDTIAACMSDVLTRLSRDIGRDIRRVS